MGPAGRPRPRRRQAQGGHNRPTPKTLPDPPSAKRGQSTWAEQHPPRVRPCGFGGLPAGLLRPTALAWEGTQGQRVVRQGLVGLLCPRRAGWVCVCGTWCGVCACTQCTPVHVCVCMCVGHPFAGQGSVPGLLPSRAHSPGRRLALTRGPVKGLSETLRTIPRTGLLSLARVKNHPRKTFSGFLRRRRCPPGCHVPSWVAPAVPLPSTGLP